MKILRIVSSGYEQGGVENGLVLTNALLTQRGHVVKTISSDSRPDLAHYSDYEFKHVPEHGIKKIIYGTFNFSAYSVTKKVLAGFKPDVVLLHTMSQPTAAILFLLKKYPTVLFVHGPEVFTKTLLPWYLPQNAYKQRSYDLRNLTISGRLRYYYLNYLCGSLYRLGIHHVDKIVALSNYTLSFLVKEHLPAVYIPNGAKLMEPARLSHTPPVLLYVGRLEKFKGVDDLIHAMPEVLRHVPKATLRIAGDGTYAEELRKLSEDMHLEQTVTFLGHLNQEQVANSYKQATLLIVPSTWPETFGKVGIEAMSVGRPVIATDVGGVRDWLFDGQNGFLIQPGHPEQIAAKAITILTDEHLAERMARSGRQTAKRFSMEGFTDNIETLISEVYTSPNKQTGHQ